ncbi:MAG TPA: hypothetical protein VF939_02210 [Puia sp.]
MKWIVSNVFCFLILFTSTELHAQTDSVRYAGYQGTYFIITPSFPVKDVKVYWKDSTLAFNAGGAKGLLTHMDGEVFRFNDGDHEGTVTFTRDERSKVSGIKIYMDGETYEGTKKKTGKKPVI